MPFQTDFTYDNLGIPKNPVNPFYDEPDWNPQGYAWVDAGLGGFLQSLSYPEDVYDPEFGKFKVPTLRNVDKRPDPSTVKAYGHKPSSGEQQHVKLVGYSDLQGRETLQVTAKGDRLYVGHHEGQHSNPLTGDMINDADIDSRGLVYASDRAGSGLFVLQYTKWNREPWFNRAQQRTEPLAPSFCCDRSDTGPRSRCPPS